MIIRTKQFALIAGLFSMMLLGGCGYKLIKQGTHMDSGGFKVSAKSHDWSLLNRDKEKVWTYDGVGLQSLILYPAIKKDEWINTQHIEDQQTFDPAMSEQEIMELFVRHQKRNWQQIKASNLAPAELGGYPGFTFDLHFQSKDGVAYRSFVRGAVVQDRLYLAHYYGTDIHYFDAERLAVEAILDDAKLILTKEM
uniref:Lipoprotein n=1 Tax=Magnetococcus massalia (strain MO-1) TaxID=451514 RepID=A0A1S7LQB0_MAGMO|nr:Conserved protein of unknown function [Candidatus Magnetococcus massalia]